jgi:lipopolysaccharide export LptBFGC system permease protein LptF
VVVGMIGWFVVWMFRSYEGLERRLCPKRMTLLVTGIAACVMYLIRFLSPTTIAGYLVPTLSIILVSVVFYLAGTKHWLGRW